MEAPAPTEILHRVDEQTEDLHKAVATEATNAGYPATPQSVNPDDQSALEVIGEKLSDMGHDVTHVATTVTGDETAKIRIAKEKVPTSIAAGRWFKLNKKAA